MDILAIAGLVGGILLIIMINDHHRRFNESIKEHDRILLLLGRHCWLCKMGFEETACSFCFIR